jgi:hypothetical protein
VWGAVCVSVWQVLAMRLCGFGVPNVVACACACACVCGVVVVV